MRQPGGASSRRRCSTSGLSAHVRDFAFASTTSRRSWRSATVHPEHLVSAQQIVDGDLELSGRSAQLQLEHAVLGMVEGLGFENLYARRRKHGVDDPEIGEWPNA